METFVISFAILFVFIFLLSPNAYYIASLPTPPHPPQIFIVVKYA